MAISVSQAFKDAFKGPVDRTKIKVEVYFSMLLDWVDVTPWVESMSGSQEEVSGLTRGASANTLSVVFNNDDGRFSRKNTASPYYAAGKGLVPNKPIRVSAVHGDETVRLFTGNTGPWNTNAKARTCSISAQDAARLMRDLEVEPEILMDPANPGQGYYLTRVIERAAWLAGLRWDAVTTKAAEWTSTTHGGTITPTYNGGAVRAVYTQGGALVMTLDLVDLRIPVAELKGHALELIAKLAQVVDGTVYFDAQGQLVFRARMYLNDSAIPVAETFTVSSLEDVTAQANFESSQFAPLINKATVTSTPLAPVLDATGAWTEQEIVVSSFVKTEFDTGEKYPDSGDPDLFIAFPDGIRIHREPGYPSAANVTLRSSYSEDTTRELNGIGFIGGTPVFFPEAVKVAFQNNGVGKERLKVMEIRVKHFKAAEGCRGVAENAESQGLYGQRAVDASNDFIPTVAACEQLAAWKVEDGREVKDCLTLPIMYGLPWLEINDRIKVSETISHSIPIEEEFIVKRIAWSWTLAGFMFSVEACTPSPDFSASSLPVTAAITETANVNLSAVVKAGMPPQIIDGTRNLIGMNNIPSLYTLVDRVKKFAWPSRNPVLSIYDGADLYLGGSVLIPEPSGPGNYNQGCFQRVSNLTGTETDFLRLDLAGLPAGWFRNYVAVSGNKMFFGYTELATFEHYVCGIDLDTFNSAAVKAKIPSPTHTLVIDGKLYVVIQESGVNKLAVWDDLSLSRQDIPDHKYVLSSQVADLVFDGNQSIAILASGGVDLFDINSGTITTSWITLEPDEMPRSMTTDGHSWFIMTTPVSWTSANPSLCKFYPTSSGMMRDNLALGPYSGWAGSVTFDGIYLWITIEDRVLQISTSMHVVSSFSVSNVVLGRRLAFDGSAIWAPVDNGLARIPRVVSGRQF